MGLRLGFMSIGCRYSSGAAALGCSPAQHLGLRSTTAGLCFHPHIVGWRICRTVPIPGARLSRSLSPFGATFVEGAGEQCAVPNSGIASRLYSWRFCPGPCPRRKTLAIHTRELIANRGRREKPTVGEYRFGKTAVLP